MASVAEVQARVASVFDRAGPPSWPDPHPGMAAPPDDEYSRVTDPGRYRIVHARARAWAAALGEAVGARTERLTPAAAPDADRPFDRGLRVVPPRTDALPLVLLERDVPMGAADPPLAVVQIGVVRPDVVVETQPDCGCDACDSGSGDLLDAVDAAIGAVCGGPYVVLRGRTWSAQWHPGGGHASSEGRHPDVRELMDLCRRLASGEGAPLPDGVEAFVGRSWFEGGTSERGGATA